MCFADYFEILKEDPEEPTGLYLSLNLHQITHKLHNCGLCKQLCMCKKVYMYTYIVVHI